MKHEGSILRRKPGLRFLGIPALGLVGLLAGGAANGQVNNTVSVIDTSTDMLVGEPIEVGHLALGIAITPDGSRAYVANNGSGSVSVIDTATNTVVATVPVQNGPEWIAITPDGTRAYVTNENSASVSVIDTDPGSATYHTILATVPVGNGPEKVAIRPDRNRAYVTNEFSNSVSVIDTDPESPMYHSVIANVLGLSFPEGIDVTPDGTRAYVTSETTKSVFVIDTSTNLVVAGPIRVDCYPEGLAINPSGTRAYVTNAIDNDVSVIDTNPISPTYNTVIQTVAVGEDPQGVAFRPSTGNFAYVANHKSDFLAKIDTSTYEVIAVPSRCNPYAVALTPDGTRAYVTNSYVSKPCELKIDVLCPIKG